MTRRLLAALLALGLLAGAAACSDQAGGEDKESLSLDGTVAKPQLPVTVEGADGRRVTVDDISRIVPLWGNITEVVFELGLGDHVVGRDVSTTFAEAEDLPVVTRGHDVSAESVLSLKPTLVLANADSGPPEALDQIRNVGIPVLVLKDPQRVADIEARIHEIAAALGVPASGEELARDARSRIEVEQARIPKGPKPRIAFLYMRGQAGVYLIAGPGSGADSMIEAAGGIDAGTAMGLDRSFTPITSEALVEAAPDVILMTTTGLDSVGGVAGLVEIPGIAQTPAGRDRRVVTVEDGLLYSFGARTPEALRSMIDQIYGDDAGA